MSIEVIQGKGTSWEIKPGVYRYRFNLGKDPISGKYLYSPKRTLHCVSKTKRGREAELRDAMESYRRELIQGIAPKKTIPLTVADYTNQFHQLRKGTMKSELSYKREELDIKHINEIFGDIKLTALKPMTIKSAYAQIRETGRFSESELHKIHAKLSQIMKEAVEDELIHKNPCAHISVPRPASAERQALSAEEAQRLRSLLLSQIKENYRQGVKLMALQSIPHLIGTLLLLDTGMRRGEMLGLTWEHVDLEAGSIYICLQYAQDKVLREPKSRNSKRHISISNETVEILTLWKEKQKTYLKLISSRQSETTPVINNDYGKHMDPDNYNRWFRLWCSKNGFGSFSEETEEYYDSMGRKRYKRRGYQGLTPHMLRHTQATLLIGASTDIKTVQSRLGHSDVNLTLNTYSHAIAANDKAAAEVFYDMTTK